MYILYNIIIDIIYIYIIHMYTHVYILHIYKLQGPKQASQINHSFDSNKVKK